MNRRLNTILFVLAATVGNILLMSILFILLLLVFARFIAPALPAQVNQIMLMVVFLVSVIGTYVFYHRFMKYLGKKYDLQKYFGPIFGRDRNAPK